MHRRSYLLLSAGAFVGSAGCLGARGEGNTDSTLFASAEAFETEGGDEYATHSFQGSATDTDEDDPESGELTDSFDLAGEGPTVLEYDHDGEADFSVWFVDEDGDRQALGYGAYGPFEGRTIHDLDPGPYALSVQADGEWDLTVYDFPVYNSGRDLPVEVDGMLTDVIGPIEFPESEDIAFTISGENSREHAGLLFDRHGELGPQVFGVEGDIEDETVVGPVSGVGYLFVESSGTWEVAVETSD